MAMLAGCAHVTSIPPDVDATGMPNAELALDRSMARVDAAMRTLGGTAASYNSPPPATPLLPAELRRPVTFAWSGPIDAGAKALADRIGYRLVITRPSNAPPVDVAINMTDVPIVRLFEALGEAAGSRATVIVTPNLRQVDVQHHV
jgi:defect-in-organelle-trafficking protein DotD